MHFKIYEGEKGEIIFILLYIFEEMKEIIHGSIQIRIL